MNRETRRRLKQNEVVKRSVIMPDASKLREHERIRKALDEGIMVGFSAASALFEKVAMSVSGIGQARAKKIREAFEEEIKRIQEEIGQ